MGKESAKRYQDHWYCSNCRLGPWNLTLDLFCPDCGHQRCTECSTSKEPLPSR